jgi:hypothetical protein
MDDLKSEKHDRSKGVGVYKMIDDIHDHGYQSPLATLRQFKHIRTEEHRYNEVTDVFWWVGFLLVCILGFFYLLGVYFTYFSDPQEFYNSVDNSKRIEAIKYQAIQMASEMKESNTSMHGVVEN